MSPQTTESRSASQRDARGRFTRNNDGGPGNPFGRRVAELRAILLRSATEDRMDVEEWKLACESSVPAGELNEKVLGMPITVGLASVPAVRKVREQEFAEAMRDPEKFYAQMDDELTPEELAEEEEMIREMRAAREASAGSPAPAVSPVGQSVGGESPSQPDSHQSFTQMVADVAAGESPSPNGGFGGGRRQPSAANGRSRTPTPRAG
jgi:hypothetical protein